MYGCTPAAARPSLSRVGTPLAALLALFALAAAAAAAPPAGDARTQLVGQPAALVVQPEAITLNGPRAVQQVVVTGKYADGSVRDLTPVCDFSVEAADVAEVTPSGFVQPKKSGTT